MTLPPSVIYELLGHNPVGEVSLRTEVAILQLTNPHFPEHLGNQDRYLWIPRGQGLKSIPMNTTGELQGPPEKEEWVA